MADDLNETPDDSIASALASALAEHEKAADAPIEAAPKPAPKAAPQAPEKAADSDAAKSAPAGQDSEAEAGEPKEGAGAAPEEKAGEETPAGTEPPANWKAADKETFKRLPPDAQKFLLTRYKEMEAGFTKKTQEIAEFRREFDPVNKIFEPYRDRMKGAGWTPAKLVEAWANVEKRLMEGDGVNVVAGLVQAYQINMGQVAHALGLRPRQPANNGNGAAQPGEPQHGDGLSLSPDHPLMRQLYSIQSRLDADDRARMDVARRHQTDAESRVMNQIEEFKSALDGQGNALHPHFEELEDTMTQLAQSALAARKPVPSLKDLYEAALWANPSTREATLAARERAQQEKNAADARAKAVAARKAGSSVTGAPGPGQAPTGKSRTDLSLREQLEASFSDHAGGRI